MSVDNNPEQNVTNDRKHEESQSFNNFHGEYVLC